MVRAYGIHKKQSWLLPTRLLHITRTDENQIPAVLILITPLKDVSGCVFDASLSTPNANDGPVGAAEGCDWGCVRRNASQPSAAPTEQHPNQVVAVF